jgi:hypothetical protein
MKVYCTTPLAHVNLLQVGVDFVGTVHNSGGAENLPVSTLQFWQMSAAHLAGFSIANSPMHQ